MGTENSETRRLLLDIAARLMLEEGYAAVGIRRVAREAEVAPALVLYYFRTLDDLFIALLRRTAEGEFRRLERMLNSAHALRGLWAYTSESSGTALTMEFVALANHRKTIRTELASQAERLRGMQIEAITNRMNDYGIDSSEMSAAAILMLINSVSRIVVMEQTLGISAGHAEIIDLVQHYIQRYEGDSQPPEATGQP